MRVQCRAGAALNLMLWLNLKVDGALMAALRSYALPGEAVPLTALRLLAMSAAIAGGRSSGGYRKPARGAAQSFFRVVV